MTVVRMMQVATDEVIGVVAVWDCLVPATRSVLMTLLGAHTPVIWRAPVRVSVAHRDHMLDHGRSFLMVKMPVVKIVLMPIVTNLPMPAIRSMRVRVIRMRLELHMSSGHGSMLRRIGRTIDAPALATGQP